MPLSFMNMPLLSYANEVTIPTLIVTGEKAHSRYFAEDAFRAIGSNKKELVIVPGQIMLICTTTLRVRFRLLNLSSFSIPT